MSSENASDGHHFIPFQNSIESIELPNRFTFPFYYDPHPLAIIAAKEIQEHIKTQKDWDHNFGIEEGKEGLVIGKMFGVLVVENNQGQLGYLAAFSGKLAGENHHPYFVPPVFDILDKDGFFRKGEEIVNQINAELENAEKDPAFAELNSRFMQESEQVATAMAELKFKIKSGKQARKILRQKAEKELSEEVRVIVFESLRKESLKEQYFLKDQTIRWKDSLANLESQVNTYKKKIEELREERKVKSSSIQKEIFEKYYFLNQAGEQKSLFTIFTQNTELNPPAGAGECAAPKLIQYAFLHGLKPIALAEFWWGQSPASEVRKHKQFYPACRGKCEPILAHMLEGIEMDENPMLTNPAEGKELEIVYEDESLLVVNKPAEFLSVPGITIYDSVYARMKLRYPDATGPLIVHRLDMSTSGLLLIAKSKEIHKKLQRQFINQIVKKRYIALIEGVIEEDEGVIELPLRVDLDDRPRQMVCYEHGKKAKTLWKVHSRLENQTRIYFYPVTGRTHQLRVHAAHINGLNAPIIGDDLYGTKGERLHLHAEQIEFKHPVTRETMILRVDPKF